MLGEPSDNVLVWLADRGGAVDRYRDAIGLDGSISEHQIRDDPTQGDVAVESTDPVSETRQRERERRRKAVFPVTDLVDELHNRDAATPEGPADKRAGRVELRSRHLNHVRTELCGALRRLPQRSRQPDGTEHSSEPPPRHLDELTRTVRVQPRAFMNRPELDPGVDRERTLLTREFVSRRSEECDLGSGSGERSTILVREVGQSALSDRFDHRDSQWGSELRIERSIPAAG
ncbi:MAG: hypothetical protein ABJH68_00065 [Ilumatobacter sp.]|uniref:hypothetical protein n=1 Tax=Ilumatobacter sp. TaxID=1967498 RepID=UPI0032985E8E